MEKLTKKEKKEQRKAEWEEKLQKERRNSLIKKIALWLGGTIVLILGIWVLLISTTSSPQSETSSFKIPPATTNDIATGPSDAKVAVIEYADFQCPACAAYAPITKQLREKFKGKVNFVSRFFPLPQHKQGMISSQAGYAAHLQGKFWEMEKLLYDNQTVWSQSTDPVKIFNEYALTLNLDLNKFNTDLNAESTKQYIREQANEGAKAGISSTPSFFINGNYVRAKDYAEFKQLIQNELDKNK